MIPMFRKSRTSSVALLFAPWKDEYFLGVMNDLRDLFMNSLLSLSSVISDFARLSQCGEKQRELILCTLTVKPY